MFTNIGVENFMGFYDIVAIWYPILGYSEALSCSEEEILKNLGGIHDETSDIGVFYISMV